MRAVKAPSSQLRRDRRGLPRLYPQKPQTYDRPLIVPGARGLGKMPPDCIALPCRLSRRLFAVFAAFGMARRPQRRRCCAGTDLPGLDYSTIKDTDLDACSAACADDKICRAFTFNESANWCFLKSACRSRRPLTGATSGTITLTAQRCETSPAARESDLPFPASDLIYSRPLFRPAAPQQRPAAQGPDLCRRGHQRATRRWR